MPRLLWGNFSFEEDLAGERQNLPLPLLRLEAELACCWLAVAEAGDWIWCPQPIDAGFVARMIECGLPAVRPVSDQRDVPTDVEFVPWGWSDRARKFAAVVGVAVDAPSSGIVRRANSRRFGLRCEIEQGVVPPGVAAVESMAALGEMLQTVPHSQHWVLKADFSHAARERILGRGGELTPDQARWAAKRLDRDGILVFEPWFERLAEAGVQWTVPRSGRPVLEGVTPLLTDSQGQYLGSRFGVDDEAAGDWEPAVQVCEWAVRELQSMGYFGPVGIDAARYRNEDGAEFVRPLQDINARWTMGRLSLGWRRLASSGTWRHGTREQFEQARLKKPQQCVATSPESIGDQVVRHRTWLEIDA